MTDAVKSVFISWLNRRSQSDKSSQEMNVEFEENLLGAARFVKEVATKIDDMELLGLATKVEAQQIELFEFLFNDQSNFDDETLLYEQQKEDIRKYCIDVFYKQNRYAIDMTEFSSVVEDNKDKLIAAGTYKNLQKYVSSQTALDKVYNEIKHNLCKNYLGRELTHSLLDELVQKEKEVLYRRAKKHLENKLS